VCIAGASSYILEVAPEVTGATYQVVAPSAGIEIPRLAPGSSYSFRVASVDTKGRQSSGWSRQSSVNTGEEPWKRFAAGAQL